VPSRTASKTHASPAGLVRRMVADAERLRSRLDRNGDADSIAQAAVCGAAILADAPADVLESALRLIGPLHSWEKIALAEASALLTEYAGLNRDPPNHLYERFLHKYAAVSRRRHGVFFTPKPIVDYIVAETDRLLRECCGMPDGIADENITIIDPACGTGIFLLAAIDRIYRAFSGRHPANIERRWNDYVPKLLSRLVGVEILPAAALLARLNIAMKLAETGYKSKIQNPKSKIFPVLLGNPPFSSLSTNTGDWIARLVRGDDEIRGYVRANGQQLGERKTWLHDDYVKFIRLAQWHVEQVGCGIIGFVTNHGYLDNATFRLMRHELLRVFEHIRIVDLHGNRKKHETAPDGSRDENVFGLDQGVAIGLFCRPRTLARSASEGIPRLRFDYAELWGTRDAKQRVMEAAIPSLALRARVVTPRPPDWRFVPTSNGFRHPEYDSAWSLADAMPMNATAPVTARDHFVVAFTPEELEERIEAFRDLSIPDEEIRQRFFTRTRSARYQAGDTRGWKLAETRRIVAADGDWRRYIVRCLYRPFDWRYVFWHPAMIDWPRHEVTRHLLKGSGCLCLLARRQQLPTQPCTFFWIADCLPLDGVIRSDNRGSESLFPLYLFGDEPDVEPEANFAPAFIECIACAARLTWLPLGRGDLVQTFGPENLLAYIYALFHAPSYRERYADALRSDFPRVMSPQNREVFERLSVLGAELIDLHLLRSPAIPLSALSTLHFPGEVANFRAGGYVALCKWLQPPHRSVADPQYTQIAAAIGRTLEIMQAIDAAIA
jgi:predicted helicase